MPGQPRGLARPPRRPQGDRRPRLSRRARLRLFRIRGGERSGAGPAGPRARREAQAVARGHPGRGAPSLGRDPVGVRRHGRHRTAHLPLVPGCP